jgi:exopolyphosphatase/guanosine-5'-triphosphate,3'-diphosphate pyrophosphatase
MTILAACAPVPSTLNSAHLPDLAPDSQGLHWRGVLAAVDLGSNSFRLELAQIREGRYQRIAYLKEMVRLGGGLDARGRLTPLATQRGLACLARFRQRLGGLPAMQLRAVATQTLREAGNRDEFLARAAEALGYPIEVISGREEARLIYAGVSRIEPAAHPRLVIDIGGRSTEIILGRNLKPQLAESFQIGSVSLSERYFSDGRCTEHRFRQAQINAEAVLEESVQAFRQERWDEALGSSGTASAVSQILLQSGRGDGAITQDGLRWLRKQCVAADALQSLELPGLLAERRAVLPGGLAILGAVMNEFGIDEIRPTRAALRQGVIFDLHQRIQVRREKDGHSWQDETVGDLQRRFQCDRAHAARVQQLAQHLFGQIAPDASAVLQQELVWAARLHEIGMSISHHDHHRHSAYLLAHIDAPGFSQSQQRRLADLVLGQRGGLRKVEAVLGDAGRAAQVLALRLAVLFCHARNELGAFRPGLVCQQDTVVLRLDRAWAAEYPRSMHLLREEVANWSRASHLTLELQER